ncbi:MAG: sigma-E processing peptidase SpoIIGA [Lachnospiraceae bacterium]|nr:sigma-E processing peptidase SpoIIGA [Lachnospiraceae bacterium]
MYYEFYIDQFFVEQLISGYLLLSAAGILCGISPGKRTLAAGALLNAACVAGAVICGFPGLFPAGFLAAWAAVFWKQGSRRGWRDCRKTMTALLVVTICFGGALQALASIIPFPVLVLLVPALELIRVLSGFVARQSREKENLASVTLCCDGKSLILKGLLDTGNQLTEPLTASPVSIAQKKNLEPLLAGGWEERQGFFLVPYHSLGTEKGWMQGILFDEMRVVTSRGSRIIKKPVIALYDGNVSFRQGYQMILHPDHAP